MTDGRRRLQYPIRFFKKHGDNNRESCQIEWMRKVVFAFVVYLQRSRGVWLKGRTKSCSCTVLGVFKDRCTCNIPDRSNTALAGQFCNKELILMRLQMQRNILLDNVINLRQYILRYTSPNEQKLNIVIP